MNRCLLVGLFLAFLPVACVSSASASDVTYDFTVTATSGPLDGQVSSGTFTYDSSVVDPGQDVNGSNLLTDLNFTWEGVSYTAATANTGWLGFDSTGALNSFCFGNNSFNGGCEVNNFTNQWYVQPSFIQYAEPGYDGFGAGTVTFSLAAPAATPEPGTLGMLGTALLAGAGLIRRRLRA
jgi:hypothetical protein